VDGGDDWKNVNMVIGPQEHGYEIIFEAYHGTSRGTLIVLVTKSTPSCYNYRENVIKLVSSIFDLRLVAYPYLPFVQQ